MRLRQDIYAVEFYGSPAVAPAKAAVVERLGTRVVATVRNHQLSGIFEAASGLEPVRPDRHLRLERRQLVNSGQGVGVVRIGLPGVQISELSAWLLPPGMLRSVKAGRTDNAILSLMCIDAVRNGLADTGLAAGRSSRVPSFRSGLVEVTGDDILKTITETTRPLPATPKNAVEFAEGHAAIASAVLDLVTGGPLVPAIECEYVELSGSEYVQLHDEIREVRAEARAQVTYAHYRY